MRQLETTLLLPVLAACLAFSLLGCDTGLDFDNESLPAPSITLAAAPAACSGAGGGSFSFTVQDVIVRENFGASPPRNRLEVSGTVDGIGMDDSVQLLLFDDVLDCPIIEVAAVTVVDGGFVAIIDYDELTAFRAALVAHAGVSDDLDCPTDGDCLTSAAGSFSAVSQRIEVRLR